MLLNIENTTCEFDTPYMLLVNVTYHETFV